MAKRKLTQVILTGSILLLGFSLTGCTDTDDDTTNQSNPELTECYTTCDDWGGNDVDICKKNCDASFDSNSVWNQDEGSDETDVDNENSISSWEDMPSEVPEFTSGDFVSGETGLGSWIVDYKNVNDDALESYDTILEDAGWQSGIIKVSGMITGSTDGYSITVNIDEYQDTAQIIVRKAN